MKKNVLKLGFLAFMLVAGTALQAQSTGADIARQTDAALGDETTPAAATAGADAFTAPTPGATVQGGAIRLIDNKGTKKYLQVQNGLTQLTNTAPDGGVITTWQLGGQLADDTDIDFNGHAFSFNNVLQVDVTDVTNGIPATTTTTASGQGNTGWTLLVRDEASGEIKKMLATDLIVSGQTVFTATAGTLTYDVTAGTPAMAGAQIPLPDYEKVWVYRNGAKLVAGVDYTIATSVVTLVENTTAPNDWTLYTGDVIEVQYYR
jgi:hypothetical protein